MRSFLSRSSKKDGSQINKSKRPNPINSLIVGTNAMRLAKENKHRSEMNLAADSNTNSISTPVQSAANSDNLVNGRYEVLKKLGEGSFGEVRLAMDIKLQQYVAIKFEHKSDLKRHLNTEYRVYCKLRDSVGFPRIFWFGKYSDYSVLVMDRLGVSLKALYSRCNRIFDIQTVCLIGIQLLDRLQTLHETGWLHQDIKPENVVIGYGDSGDHGGDHNVLYLIDYGTSDEYIDSATHKHRVRAPSTKIVGTARYSSLNNHYGYKQSRRDDLESLGYTLIYWLLGRLPWQGIDEKDFRIKWKKVRRIKRSISPDDLCKGLPVQFRIYIKYVFKLSYTQPPNYAYLRALFRQLIRTRTANNNHSDAIDNSNNNNNNNKRDTSAAATADSIRSNINLSAKRFAWQKFGINCK